MFRKMVLAIVCVSLLVLGVTGVFAGGPGDAIGTIEQGFAQKYFGGWYALEEGPSGHIVHVGQTYLIWTTDIGNPYHIYQSDWFTVPVNAGTFGTYGGTMKTWTPKMPGVFQLYTIVSENTGNNFYVSRALVENLNVLPAQIPTVRVFVIPYFNPENLSSIMVDIKVWNEVAGVSTIYVKMAYDGQGYFTVSAKDSRGNINEYHYSLPCDADVLSVKINGKASASNLSDWTFVANQNKTALPSVIRVMMMGGKG